MFDASSVEQIKESSAIEDIIADYVSLRPKGNDLWALCPFHAEKTPSFSVSPALGFYKCFGCGKGGDVISFVREINGYNYVEALQYLATRSGISLRIESNGGQSEAYRKKEALYALMRHALAFYARQLADEKEGQVARLYLAERGIDRKIWEAYGLGYANEKGSTFMSHATGLGYEKNQLIQASLTSREARWDFFTARLLFPVHDVSGRVIAFGGRRLDKGEPKYLNSAESKVYKKQEVLYGLYQARQAIHARRHAYLVEGYMDLISLVQAGFQEVVAVSGTAFTPAQAVLLKRFADQVSILFDGDKAGRTAAMKAGDLLLAAGAQVQVIRLPEEADPDDCLKKEGLAGFKENMDKRKETLVGFKIKERLPLYGSSPQGRTRLLYEEFLPTLARVQNETMANEMLKEVVLSLHFDEAVFNSKELKATFVTLREKQEKRPLLPQRPSPPSPPSAEPATKEPKTPLQPVASLANNNKLLRRERELLGLLLRYGRKSLTHLDQGPSLAGYLFKQYDALVKEYGIPKLLVAHPMHAAFYDYVKTQCVSKGGTQDGMPPLVGDLYNDPQWQGLIDKILYQSSLPDPWMNIQDADPNLSQEKLFQDSVDACLLGLCEACLGDEIKRIRAEIRVSEDAASPEAIEALLKRHQAAKQKQNEIIHRMKKNVVL